MSTGGVDSTSSKEQSHVLRRVRDRGKLTKRLSRRKSCTTFCPRSKQQKLSTDESTDDTPFTENSLTRSSPWLSRKQRLSDPSPLMNASSPSKPVELVALDCEMVETRNGSALAQCSIVSYDGEVLFHEYVRPVELIVDYRTRWSGILPHHMKCALPHDEAVTRIIEILSGKICIGHDLWQDFSVIGLTYQKSFTRDTVRFKPLRTLAGLAANQNPSLRNLALHLLNRRIQIGSHDSLEDARTALDLYRKYEHLWENYLVEQDWDKAVWLQDQFWPQEIVAQC